MAPPPGITHEWRGAFHNAEVNRLHAQGFGHPVSNVNWRTQLSGHSLGWVCARRDRRLVGFVNVAWDGRDHAFLVDTLVAGAARRTGVGTELVATAKREAEAAGCEWLHVDFTDHLSDFYIGACGFQRSPAGVVRLRPAGVLG